MSSLVFFHAHPDDEALATGGTIAQATAEGHNITLVFATRGEVGEVPDGFLKPGVSLGETREAEARAAAEILGVQRVEFLGYRDSGLENTVVENPDSTDFCNADPKKAAEGLRQILDDVKADLLTIYDPNGGYGHPDHIQVHRVGTLAGEMADNTPKILWATMNRDHFLNLRDNNEEMRRAMQGEEENSPDKEKGTEEEKSMDGWLEKDAPKDPEKSSPLDEPTFGMADVEISHFINILPFLDQKIQAIRAHASQIGEDSMFFKISEATQREAFGTEWFHLPSATKGGQKFTSLFEG